MYELYPLFCTLHGIFCYLEDSCGTEDPEPHHVTLLNIAAYWPYPVCVQDTQNKKLSERQNHPGVIHVKVIYWHVPGNMLPSLSNQQGGQTPLFWKHLNLCWCLQLGDTRYWVNHHQEINQGLGSQLRATHLTTYLPVYMDYKYPLKALIDT